MLLINILQITVLYIIYIMRRYILFGKYMFLVKNLNVKTGGSAFRRPASLALTDRRRDAVPPLIKQPLGSSVVF